MDLEMVAGRTALAACFVYWSSLYTDNEYVKQDSRQIGGMAVLKIVFSLTVLQVVWNVLETEGFFDNPDLLAQVTNTDAHMSLDHFRQKREALNEYHDYIIDIELNVSSIIVIGQLKSSLNSVSLPIQLDDTINITDINITTVCSPDGTGFQCICEEEFVWSLENCQTYSNCSAITDNTCGCINAIPTNGSFCQLKPDIPVTTTVRPTSTVPPRAEYFIDIEVNVADIAVIDQLRSLLRNAPFPIELDSMLKINDVNLTTVCYPNGTGFQCRCEEGFAWSLENCQTYSTCSAITENTCGCINAIPTNGSFCQPKADIAETTTARPTSTDIPETTTVRPTSTVPPRAEYIIDIEVNVADIAVIDQLRSLLRNAPFPIELDSMLKINDVNLTTVCYPNGTGFQCRCEEGFAWSLENCQTYSTCSAITENTCGCINAIPTNGSFCQPKAGNKPN
ncbi:hypothetical protein AAFF_G00436600 [Aldrovandia affinis]|uniref:ADGRF3/5-like N-terminal domain-containing protein n=1 Tax=Aldrovandia affinis TaxID=143900 RepID=A0AAD7WHX0_9TELE|nr:hypothetical protein AAFF_G00436600 [Aldrovandia affinis]